MTEKNLTCIICPRGCSIHAVLDDSGNVTVAGNFCKRGESYAISEMTNPVRTLTGTVRTVSGEMLPVRTEKPIPRDLLFEGMKVLKETKVGSGIKVGDIIVADFCGTGINLIATGNID